MTVCNMSIEAGARAGLIAPDETTFAYLQGRPVRAHGPGLRAAVAHWRTLPADPGATYDARGRARRGRQIQPQVTWGTNPGQVLPVDGRVPDPAKDKRRRRARAAVERALAYMGLKPGTPITDIRIDRVFIGSCTNARIEDLRAAAAVVARGSRVAQQRAAGAWSCPAAAWSRRRPKPKGCDEIFTRRRLRVARGRLQHVPGHEPRQAGARRALRVAPATATSKAARARAAAPTWSARPWPPPPPSPATSSTSAHGLKERPMRPTDDHPSALLAVLGLSGCNTIEGLGKDISKAGDASRLPPKEQIDPAMQPFTMHPGLVAPMDRANVDTDPIIPKQFLKWIERTGFGPTCSTTGATSTRRAGPGPGIAPAQSRLRAEPAALRGAQRSCWRAATSAAAPAASTRPGRWSDYGFRVRDRAQLRRHLLQQLLQERHAADPAAASRRSTTCSTRCAAVAGYRLTVDLRTRRWSSTPDGCELPFEVDPFRKHCLLNGLDDIGLTLRHADKIKAFEAERLAQDALAGARRMLRSKGKRP